MDALKLTTLLCSSANGGRALNRRGVAVLHEKTGPVWRRQLAGRARGRPARPPLASTALKLLPCASTCSPGYVAAKSRRIGRNIWPAGPMDGRLAHLWRQPTPSRFAPGRPSQGVAGRPVSGIDRPKNWFVLPLRVMDETLLRSVGPFGEISGRTGLW
jgi:hypothetical protein